MEDNKQDLEKMNRLKSEYEDKHMTEKQLESVKATIAAAKQEKRRGRRKVIIQRCSVAAAVIAAFVILPNTSPVVANAMQNIPVLGKLARVVTFRSYAEKTDDLKISVNIPSVELIAEDTNGLADAINQEIYDRCEEYCNEAITRAEEYREAFLATGGTQEEWEAHHIEITVDYEIKSQTEDILSFTVNCYENWNFGSNETRYYNMDIQSEKIITLEDILGEDYVDAVNTSIQAQIQERTAGGEVFWTPEEGGFTGISEDTKFYMNQAGNPVIVFDKYEIAPGSSGEVEFEIARYTEEAIADTQGTKETEEAEAASDAVYEDNFSVDKEAVVAFAGKIKEAVANQDIEALADLASYPLYAGFEDGGVTVASREELVGFGAEKIFTPEMMDSIKNADENSLSPSMAGFALYSNNGPNMVFGVVDGKLAIQGINY